MVVCGEPVFENFLRNIYLYMLSFQKFFQNKHLKESWTTKNKICHLFQIIEQTIN